MPGAATAAPHGEETQQEQVMDDATETDLETPATPADEGGEADAADAEAPKEGDEAEGDEAAEKDDGDAAAGAKPEDGPPPAPSKVEARIQKIIGERKAWQERAEMAAAELKIAQERLDEVKDFIETAKRVKLAMRYNPAFKEYAEKNWPFVERPATRDDFPDDEAWNAYREERTRDETRAEMQKVFDEQKVTLRKQEIQKNWMSEIENLKKNEDLKPFLTVENLERVFKFIVRAEEAASEAKEDPDDLSVEQVLRLHHGKKIAEAERARVQKQTAAGLRRNQNRALSGTGTVPIAPKSTRFDPNASDVEKAKFIVRQMESGSE